MPNDLFSISGRTAVVTGGSSGIGLMIARGFVDAGARVYIASRKADVCERVAAELSEGGGSAIAVPADLSTDAGAAGLAEAVGATEDSIDILVNNAGATWGAALADHDEASWNRVLDLNVQGVFHTTKHFLSLLRVAATPDDPARVINIASIDGIRAPLMETYSYGASKAAVIHLTRHLARHLSPDVTVNAVAPGPFESKMMRATMEAFEDQIVSTTPMHRIGRPDDMAGVAIYLASRAGSYVTGATIPVDGGITNAG